MAARVEALQWPGVTVERDYQLAIEHAALVAEHDLIVFADADIATGAPFYLRAIAAAPDRLGLSHHLSAPAVLQLAADCFQARPRAWALGIRAIDLDSFGEGLTPEAQKNSEAAIGALRDAIERWRREWQRHLSPATRARQRRVRARANRRTRRNS